MNQRALSKHSESTQRSLRDHSEGREYFVIPSEPKILRLVSMLSAAFTLIYLGTHLSMGLDNKS